MVVLPMVIISACRQDPSPTDDTNSAYTGVSVNQPTPSTGGKSLLDDRTRQALLEALADERRARSTYDAVIAKFGGVPPFSNIVTAERRHESVLLALFEKYNVEVPADVFKDEDIDVGSSLAEACGKGVAGENSNIAMYDRFLEFVTEEDIRSAFTYLRDASKNNHLPAFLRCSERGSGRIKGGRKF